MTRASDAQVDGPARATPPRELLLLLLFRRASIAAAVARERAFWQVNRATRSYRDTREPSTSVSLSSSGHRARARAPFRATFRGSDAPVTSDPLVVDDALRRSHPAELRTF